MSNAALRATLRYVTAPTAQQLEGIRAFLAQKYAAAEVDLQLLEDASLVNGFKLTVGNEEYDWSAAGRLEQLKQRIGTLRADSPENLIQLLKTEIRDFDLEAKNQEIGFVRSVGDGIAIIDGIDHAAYGEIVVFDSGVKGMVQDVRADNIGVILFGSDTDVLEGSRVCRTGKNAGIATGNAMLGRVVDALGAPIDGLGGIKADENGDVMLVVDVDTAANTAVICL